MAQLPCRTGIAVAPAEKGREDDVTRSPGTPQAVKIETGRGSTKPDNPGVTL